jgi:uncharacterized protein YceK
MLPTHAVAIRAPVRGPDGRRRFMAALLSGVLGGTAAGCGTTVTSRESWPHPEPFEGVQMDWDLIAHPTYGPCGAGTAGVVLGLADLPFSLAADTLILPAVLLPEEDEGRAGEAPRSRCCGDDAEGAEVDGPEGT